MIKRKLALIIASTMTMAFVLTTLTGCKNNIKANGIYDEEITIGEWLGLVNQQFWYSNSDIVPGNDEEDELQFAMEHGIVPEDGHTWDLDTLLTREIAAVTLAGAVGYENVNSIYVEDLGNSEYQNEILSVLNHGIMGLNSDNCFMPGEKVKYVEGSLYLQSAYSFWANYTFDEAVYDVVLQDNVLDFNGISDVSVNDDGELVVDEQAVAEKKQLLDDNHVQFDDVTYILKLDSPSSLGVTEGSVLILPDGYGNDGDRAIKVTSLEQQADGTYIAQTEIPAFSEIADNFILQESTEIRFMDLSKSEFFDADGNPIVLEDDTTTVEESHEIAPLAYTGDSSLMTSLAYHNQSDLVLLDSGLVSKLEEYNKTPKLKIDSKDGSGSITFEVDGCKFVATMKDSDLTIKVEYGESEKVKSDIEKTKSATHTFKSSTDEKERTAATSNESTTKSTVAIYEELKISNLDVQKHIDVRKNEYGLWVNYDMSNEFGLSGKIVKTWELFKLKYTFTPGVTLNLTFNLKISVDGTMSISVEADGCSRGFQYVNGDFRTIKDGEPYAQYDVKVKAELTFPIEISLSLVDEKVCKIYAGFDGGIGAMVEMKNNLIEYPDKEPYEVQCIDGTIYPIVKLSAGITLLKGSRIEFNVKSPDLIINNEKKGTQWKIHWENGERVDKCSVKLAEEAWTAKEQKDEAAVYGVDIGEGFVLSDSTIKLIVGESAEIRLNEIPSGYSLLDDVYACYVSVQDKTGTGDIITVNNDKTGIHNEMWSDVSSVFKSAWRNEGVMYNYLYFKENNSSSIQFTANNPGTVELYYKTKDAQYSSSCRIIVITEEEANNTPLRLSETYISVSPGNTKKLEVTSIPGTLTEEDLVWESENPSVASVDVSGNVTGITDGVTTIIVKTKDGVYSYRCTVTVFEGIDNVNAEYEAGRSYLMMQKI